MLSSFHRFIFISSFLHFQFLCSLISRPFIRFPALIPILFPSPHTQLSLPSHNSSVCPKHHPPCSTTPFRRRQNTALSSFRHTAVIMAPRWGQNCQFASSLDGSLCYHNLRRLLFFTCQCLELTFGAWLFFLCFRTWFCPEFCGLPMILINSCRFFLGVQ